MNNGTGIKWIGIVIQKNKGGGGSGWFFETGVIAGSLKNKVPDHSGISFRGHLEGKLNGFARFQVARDACVNWYRRDFQQGIYIRVESSRFHVYHNW